MSRTRRIVLGTTIVVWAGLCVLVFWHLVQQAREAPAGMIDEYARAPSFQALNFTFGYLPVLTLTVLVALGVEWGMFYLAARLRGSAKPTSD